MRKALFTSIVLAAFAVAAQEETPPVEEEGGGETEGVEVDDRPSEVKMGDPKTTAPGEVHTVVKGDTLWDLSQRYLGSPWYWPKVWSYNPEIANPHWIYPGNLVKFFPGGEEAPSQVEVGPGEEIEDVEPAQMIDPGDKVKVSGPIGFKPKASSKFLQVGFVTPKELDEAGKIDSSFSEAEMLSYPDTAYISFKNKSGAKVGDRYVVFKTVSEVRHPTGGRYGYLTKFLGTVKILTVSDKLVTAAVVDTWDEINRGDLIGPFGEQLNRQVSRRPNEKELKGFVIGTIENNATLYAEHHMVIIDKGSGDGVQPGNTFTVIRQSNKGGDDFFDPSDYDAKYPIEDVAMCMAVDVKEKASTCLIVRSLREIVWGDRVVMRPGGGGARASLR